MNSRKYVFQEFNGVYTIVRPTAIIDLSSKHCNEFISEYDLSSHAFNIGKLYFAFHPSTNDQTKFEKLSRVLHSPSVTRYSYAFDYIIYSDDMDRIKLIKTMSGGNVSILNHRAMDLVDNCEIINGRKTLYLDEVSTEHYLKTLNALGFTFRNEKIINSDDNNLNSKITIAELVIGG